MLDYSTFRTKVNYSKVKYLQDMIPESQNTVTWDMRTCVLPCLK